MLTNTGLPCWLWPVTTRFINCSSCRATFLPSAVAAPNMVMWAQITKRIHYCFIVSRDLAIPTLS